MSRPVELTEVEASMVLSNWPSPPWRNGDPPCVMFSECLPERPRYVFKERLTTLYNALFARPNPRFGRDRMAACIRVVPRRSRR